MFQKELGLCRQEVGVSIDQKMKNVPGKVIIWVSFVIENLAQTECLFQRIKVLFIRESVFLLEK